MSDIGEQHLVSALFTGFHDTFVTEQLFVRCQQCNTQAAVSIFDLAVHVIDFFFGGFAVAKTG